MKIRYILLLLGISQAFSSTALTESALVDRLMDSPDTLHEEYEAGRLAGLGESVSTAVYTCLKEGQSERALSLLRVAVELMPDDPDILGIRGVVAALAGEKQAALALLENAYVWDQGNPLVNYNLGNLLVQGGHVAEWIRGKHLLLDAMQTGDDEIVEQAGLTLLVNRRIPLLPGEAGAVYAQLDELSVFRADNPRLSDEAREQIRIRMDGIRDSQHSVVKTYDKEQGLAGAWDALRKGQAETAYKELYDGYMAGRPFDSSELDRLLALSLEVGTLPETVRIAEGRVRLGVEDPDLLDDYLYYRLLADENIGLTLGRVRELVDEHPGNPAYRVTLMLGLLKDGQPGEAMKLLEEQPVDLTAPGQRARLVSACVLSANRQTVVAEGIRESISREELLPAERDLLELF